MILLQVCIRAMAQTDCIGPMKIGMKSRRDMIGVACEALNKLFSEGEEDLVEQVVLAAVEHSEST